MKAKILLCILFLIMINSKKLEETKLYKLNYNYQKVDSSSNNQKLENKKAKKINPAVSDITNENHKLVKPFYKPEYLPEQVDSITPKINYNNPLMFSASIISDANLSQEGNQKPHIYTTIVQGHSTSVSHPVPKLTQASLDNNANHGLIPYDPRKDFPVNVIESDNWTVPINIEKKYLTKSIVRNNVVYTRMDKYNHDIVFTQSKEDINRITSRLRLAKTEEDKVKALTFGKKSIEKQNEDLSEKIHKGISKLLFAKELAIRLNTLLSKFEVTVKKSELSKMKLADVITIKNQLREKLLKDIQGIRTSSKKYSEIKKVDPKDIKSIVNQIKQKLGY